MSLNVKKSEMPKFLKSFQGVCLKETWATQTLLADVGQKSILGARIWQKSHKHFHCEQYKNLWDKDTLNYTRCVSLLYFNSSRQVSFV